MEFESQRPNRKPLDLQWQRLDVPPGSCHRLYLAGPPFGIYGHRKPVTKPCHNRFPTLNSPCPHCAAGMEPKWTGYVPTFSDDGDRYVVIINDTQEERVLRMPLHAPILVSKGKNPNSQTEIRLDRGAKRRLEFDGNVPPEQDIRHWLLVVWKDDVLKRFLGATWFGGKRTPRLKVKPVAELKPTVADTNPPSKPDAAEVKRLLGELRAKLGTLPADDATPPKPQLEKNGKHG